MIIPEQVHLLYKDYKVKKTSNLRSDSGETLYGQTQFIEQLILINDNASEDQQKATLIHELVHGLDELFGIELKEEQVEKVGNAFYMLIRDNLEMFREGSYEI